MKREPLWTVAGITAAVAAVLTLATSFGLDLTPDQHEALLATVAVGAPLAVAIFARGQVYSPASVDRLADEAAVLDPMAEDTEFDDIETEPAEDDEAELEEDRLVDEADVAGLNHV